MDGDKHIVRGDRRAERCAKNKFGLGDKGPRRRTRLKILIENSEPGKGAF